jgi:hypothetical protein
MCMRVIVPKTLDCQTLRQDGFVRVKLNVEQGQR